MREINWDYIGDAVPAFLTIIIIPLTYKCAPTAAAPRPPLTARSIAYGVIAGIFSYILINGVAWGLRRASGGRITPPNYDASEEWVIPPGGIVPPWMCVPRAPRARAC